MLIKLKLVFLLAAMMSVVGSFVLGHGSSLGAQPVTTNANEIVIQNFAFQPATLTVKVGTKVTWVNRDDDPHTATARPEGPDRRPAGPFCRDEQRDAGAAWWRWRELNPRPMTNDQDFSGRSALWSFSAPELARTRSPTGPAE